MKSGMRIKIDVTPKWWRTKTEKAEEFAGWLVKAVRLILGVWPQAEIRLSREKVVAVETFNGEERVGMVAEDKRRLREALDGIVQIEEVSDRSDTSFGSEQASDRKWFDFPGMIVETMQSRVDDDPGDDDFVPGDVIIVGEGEGCRVLARNKAGVRWLQKQLGGR